VLGGCVLVLALAVVWLNIERMHLAYELRQLQTEVERETELQARLKVERMSLLSSARLRLLAEESGLRPAGPGQIRILTIP
jgi:cell division protein FtsL